MGSWHLSVRTDRPVEGCEVTALAYLYQKSIKKKNGIPVESPQPPPPPTSEYELRFRWLRGPEAPVCAYDACPMSKNFSPLVWSTFARKQEISVQCVDDMMRRRMSIHRSSVFCGPKCFQGAWSTSLANGGHRLRAAGASEGPQRRERSESDAFPSQRPRDDSIEEDPTAWVEVCTNKVFNPSPKDVGRRFRLECTAVRRDGSPLFGPRSIRIEPVLAAPPPPPRRRLIASPNASSGGGHRFRVVSYNVLAEIYATQHAYPYCDFWALSWGYRCANLVREIQDAGADIVCLQEVQADYFEKDLKPRLYKAGFDGVFKAKTREAMGMAGKIDGCAIFWKRSKFRVTEQYSIEFNQIARSFAQAVAVSDEQERDMLNRLLKDNIAMVLVLEVLSRNPNRGPSHFCLANTHLYSNKDFPDVKLWQAHRLLMELEQLVLPRDMPLVFCGDFNSIPSSAVYELLSTSAVSDGHPDLGEDVARILPPTLEALQHNLCLMSAYAAVTGLEPVYTNYTQVFQGVLDYIWYSGQHLRPLGVLEVPTEEAIHSVGQALPNVQYSSDHVLMSVDLQLGGSLPQHRNPADKGQGGAGSSQQQSQSSSQQQQPQQYRKARR
uniref:Endonuclease/exonuclease/phosphatase domain-containing protein n=1 Tax=Rhizochromulina marina TaxID=1034831 RepID=A0A7S2RJ55_9STRA